MKYWLYAFFALTLSSSCADEKSEDRQSQAGGSQAVSETPAADDTSYIRQTESSHIQSGQTLAPLWFELQTSNTGSVMQRADYQGYAGHAAFKNLVKRNREKALWLLRNPEFMILANGASQPNAAGTMNSRFNGRICTRIITETRTAIDFAGVSVDGKALTEDQKNRLRARGLSTLRQIIAGDPYDWQVSYNNSDPTGSGGEITSLEIAEIGACIALGYRAYYELLSTSEKRHLQQAVVFVLNRYKQQYDYHFGTSCSTTCKSNWNGVINGSALMLASVARDFATVGTLGTGAEVAADTITKARAALPKYFDLFGADGVYSEGLTYVILPMEFVAIGHEMALKNIGRSVMLSSYPGVLQTGRFLADLISPHSEILQSSSTNDSLSSANFADSRAIARPSLAFLSWLGKRYEQEDMSALAYKLSQAPMSSRNLSDYGDGTMDALSAYWYRPTESAPNVRSASKLYGAVGNNSMVGMLTQTDTEKSKMYALMIGGKTVVTPHGHLDAGSFILEALGRRWSADLGPNTYSDPGYFTFPTRWNYLRATNKGHNTLTIDDTLQTVGAVTPLRLYKDNHNEKITAYLDNAYSDRATKVTRELIARSTGEFIVRDQITLRNTASVVTWRMNYCRQRSNFVGNLSRDAALCFDTGKKPPTSPVNILPGQKVRISEDQLDAGSCTPKYLDLEITGGSGLSLSVVDAEPLAEGQISNCWAILIKTPVGTQQSGLDRRIEVTLTPKSGNPQDL
jgi:hypothetical protein